MDPITILQTAAAQGDPRAAQMAAMFAANPRLLSLASGGRGREDKRLARILNERAERQRPGGSPSWAMRGSDAPHLMGLDPGSVHVQVGIPTQFQFYKNRQCIADDVLPVVPVARQADKIWEAPVATLQTLAQAQIVGSRARPNEIPYSVDPNLAYACKPYGLLDPTPLETFANADAPLNPRLLSAMVVESFLDLAREVRVANVVFSAANYGTNTTALSGSSRWDNASSDPVAAILTTKEQIFADANVLVLGGQVWPALRTNPNVIKYITSRASTNIGAVPATMQLQFFAEMLEVDAVVVGRAKYVTSNEGAASITTDYIWGKSAALLRVEPQPNPRATSCFGYTYRWGERAYRHEVITDLMAGGMGVEYLKLSHYDAEVALGASAAANPAAYLWTTVIS